VPFPFSFRRYHVDNCIHFADHLTGHTIRGTIPCVTTQQASFKPPANRGVCDSLPTGALCKPLDSDGFLRRECPLCVRCPYCGQTAPRDQWWTQEQIAYIHVFAYNIIAQIVNEQLIRPMKRKFSGRRSGFVSIKFEGKEMAYQKPWASQEPDDMTIHAFPCCDLRVKLEDDWSQAVYCPQCGFPHTIQADRAM
jgi:hypothetical protein